MNAKERAAKNNEHIGEEYQRVFNEGWNEGLEKAAKNIETAEDTKGVVLWGTADVVHFIRRLKKRNK